MLLKERIKEYIKFTPGERRGIVVLLLLLFLITGIRILLPYLSTIKASHDVSIQVMELESKKGNQNLSDKYNKGNNAKLDSEKVINEVLFDPNTATFKQLRNIGFSKYASQNVIKYRERGGHFKVKEDLKKIYGVDTVFLSEINHLIVIQEELSHEISAEEIVFEIDINLADSTELKRLPCIGSKLSSRILKYRNSLGGFYAVTQVVEVYGVDSTCFNKMKKYIVLNRTDINKLDLNMVSEKELYKHPYISKYQARAIVKYRNLIGEFTSIEQLKSNNIFSSSEYPRVRNYLTVNRN